jgi:Carbohydrate-selective porin, OprB family
VVARAGAAAGSFSRDHSSVRLAAITVQGAQCSSPTISVQFGYRTTLENDKYPRAFVVGGFFNTGSYADPLLNTAGQNRILNGGSPKTDVGGSEVYLQAQQIVYRPDGSDRGLTLFGGANWATSGEPDIEKMFFAGAYDEGLFAERPNDTLGFSSTLINVSPCMTAIPFSSKLDFETRAGRYARARCSLRLFSSRTKYDSQHRLAELLTEAAACSRREQRHKVRDGSCRTYCNCVQRGGHFLAASSAK